MTAKKKDEEKKGIDIAALAAPFDPASIHWRIGSTTKDKTRGMALAYLDARDVMDRLDLVVGVENWADAYRTDGKRTYCALSVRIGDGWVAKEDCAGDTDIESEKGGVSDAFKRAAVKWGIGRYLYRLDSPWVELDGKRIKPGQEKKLAAALNAKSGTSKPPAAEDPTPPLDPKQVGSRILVAMERRCDQLKISPADHAEGAIRSILGSLKVKKTIAEMAKREKMITDHIDVWVPPDAPPAGEFEGDPTKDSEPRGGDSSPEPKALKGDGMRALHAWGAETLATKNASLVHKRLHEALPDGIESLTDLPLDRVGELKERLLQQQTERMQPKG